MQCIIIHIGQKGQETYNMQSKTFFCVAFKHMFHVCVAPFTPHSLNCTTFLGGNIMRGLFKDHKGVGYADWGGRRGIEGGES